MSFHLLIATGFGGFFGAIARYLISMNINSIFGSSFPYGTLLVNTLGSFLLGFLTKFFTDLFLINEMLRLAVLIGFLGAFTTFSTFSMESANLIQNGELLKAGLNIMINCTLCITLHMAGIYLAGKI